ncbi:MAG: radical SAM protein [Candidatus Gracilibacteria bacterium]|nr:radical SAM protein [Candidatus Gracilibacteria bacterium]
MDLRIVNTCNNNCLYCLESNLRKLNSKYIDKKYLYDEILKNKDDKITFYGGNPLLHPYLIDIVKFCNKNNYKTIGLLTNSHGIENKIYSLIENGLTDIGIYFNSFNKNNHSKLNGGGLLYGNLLKNLKLLSKTGLNLKIIIHINNINIDNLHNDIFVLNKLYGISNFDFINYFPFDKPYVNKNVLEYEISSKRESIDLFFTVIKKLNLNVFFSKFSMIFFGKFIEFYNLEKGVVNQIGKEDIIRINQENIPFCFKENRCKYCFISDVCEIIKNNK